jgi:hypothetical protein
MSDPPIVSQPPDVPKKEASVVRRTAARVPASLDAQAELEVLIRARYPIVYVVSWEEDRVERQISEIARKRNKKVFVWTLTQGIVKLGTPPQSTKSASGSTTDPLAALDAVLGQVEPAIYIFKDFHPFTEDNRANLAVVRRLRDLAHHLRDTYKT